MAHADPKMAHADPKMAHADPKMAHADPKMARAYPLNKGTELRHRIEAVDSTWYAVFEEIPNQVKYFFEGKLYRATPERFVEHHYAAVESARDIWKECEILHEGDWKRNPTKDHYVDLTAVEDSDGEEEIVLQPHVC